MSKHRVLCAGSNYLFSFILRVPVLPPAPQFQQQQELQNTALDTFCEVRVKTQSFINNRNYLFISALF